MVLLPFLQLFDLLFQLLHNLLIPIAILRLQLNLPSQLLLLNWKAWVTLPVRQSWVTWQRSRDSFFQRCLPPTRVPNSE